MWDDTDPAPENDEAARSRLSKKPKCRPILEREKGFETLDVNLGKICCGGRNCSRNSNISTTYVNRRPRSLTQHHGQVVGEVVDHRGASAPSSEPRRPARWRPDRASSTLTSWVRRQPTLDLHAQVETHTGVAMSSPLRIRRRIDSTTLHVAELEPYMGKQVEIVVTEEKPAAQRLASTRGLLKPRVALDDDPVADTLADLRSERARQLEKTTNDLGE